MSNQQREYPFPLKYPGFNFPDTPGCVLSSTQDEVSWGSGSDHITKGAG